MWILALLTSLYAQTIELNPKQWQQLEYKSIKANTIEVSNDRMRIKVSESASPLIYPFQKPRKLKSLTVKGKVIGKIKLKKMPQGTEGNDDFVFRVGLVTSGEKTLNFFQKAIAPKWIKELHSLSKGKAQGISRIHFYNVSSDQRILNQKRVHPLSDLIHESFHVLLQEEGSFSLNLKKEDLPNEEILALWISSDGDDTKSSFEVVIDHFMLQ
ncbi:MAG: hypothetical protein VXV96_09495 [Bdellovibrionota bacterium]|nr:hypothetical protein [Bdellovibrionota bacterium]